VRAAEGSDNFPITWGDDDRLYTAYGDGHGFAPQTEEKLSLGFAGIEGTATDFRGSNIRSPAEQYGDGRVGKKASGMLMVNGTLYMWVRNANNNGEGCQLAWSTDRAQTWTWSDWSFGEFGFCTFINFGRNYAGARDEYVYTVTPDGPSAYTPADRFVLLRVPQTQITDRNAYEFLVTVGDDNTPTWTRDITQRGAMFTNPGRALRSGISYNPGLGRYLWWQSIREGGPDSRYEGGFGVFDAPEPWGPWTTAFYTEKWDVGPGEAGSFPTKWMSDDGRTVHLVFSGDDAFSVRRATLTTAAMSGELNEETVAAPSPAATSGLVTQSYMETATPTAMPVAPPTAAPPPTFPPTATPVPIVLDAATPTPVSILEPPTPTAVPTEPGALAASNVPFQSPLAEPQQNAAQPQSPLPSPTPTPALIPTQAATANDADAGAPAAHTSGDTAAPTPETVATAAAEPTATETATSAPAPSETPTVMPTATAAATATATPTTVPVALPAAGTTAPEDPLAALFRLETVLLVLLCLVSVTVSALGFSALIVTVLYIRSQSAAEHARRASEEELRRARRVAPEPTQWRRLR
jgi:hypothetical protein